MCPHFEIYSFSPVLSATLGQHFKPEQAPFPFTMPLTHFTMLLPNYVKRKGKVVPVLFLTEHHAMKAYWGVDV
jgi:hypothetical protein